MKNRSRTIITVLLLIIAFSFILYRSSFQSYFFQDDWFTLRVSHISSLKDFFNFFLPRSDVIYYRPLGMQIPFSLLYMLFGLSPLPFHIFIFLIHIVNIILLYIFLKLLSQREDLAYFTSFFYGTSAIHFIPFYWVSTMAFPLGLQFTLLTFISFLCWFNNKKLLFLASFFVFEIFSFFTYEIAVLIPLFIIIYMKIYKKFNMKIAISIFILPIFYSMLRILYLPKLTDTYSLVIGKKTISALFSYLLWLFNWPEEIKNQLENIRAGNYSFFLSFPTLNISLLLMTIVFIYFLIRYLLNPTTWKKSKDRNILTLSIIFMPLSLIFPLLFPLHTYPYYLCLSLIALSIIISLSFLFFLKNLVSPMKELFLILVLSLWLFSSLKSLEFSMINHWAPTRAKISQVIITDLKKRYPQISTLQKIYLYNDPYLKVILSNQDAFKVIYNKNIATIYYGKEDVIWKDTGKNDPQVLKERLKWNYVQ